MEKHWGWCEGPQGNWEEVMGRLRGHQGEGYGEAMEMLQGSYGEAVVKLWDHGDEETEATLQVLLS